MVNPILEEELRRARRIKQYQNYQNMIDSVKDSSNFPSSGKMDGKTVKKLSNDNSLGKIFNKFNESYPK